jgi:hypothetical protein
VQFNKKVNSLWSSAVTRMELDVEGGVEAAKNVMASASAVVSAAEKKSF